MSVMAMFRQPSPCKGEYSPESNFPHVAHVEQLVVAVHLLSLRTLAMAARGTR
jgi:hypothetical protein